MSHYDLILHLLV